MSLDRTTDLGIIRISDNLIVDAVLKALHQPECEDKLWISTRLGNEIGMLRSWNAPASKYDVTASFGEKGDVKIEFNIIIRFGLSIHKYTRIVADAIRESLREIASGCPLTVTINIAGVRSKKIARRHTRTVYHYAAD